MKKLILVPLLFLFLSKSYSQEQDTLIEKPLTAFSVQSLTETEFISDRRLIGISEVSYIIQNGVTMQHGFVIDPEAGILYVPTPSNSTTIIIYKK